jgi:hypothetical protein
VLSFPRKRESSNPEPSILSLTRQRLVLLDCPVKPGNDKTSMLGSRPGMTIQTKDIR